MRSLATVATLLCSVGSWVDSVCYNDTDCPDTHLCHRPPAARHGECRKQCAIASDCHNPGRACGTRPYVSGPVCLDRCAGDGGCPIGWSCDVGTGICSAGECRVPDDCGHGFTCQDGVCIAPAGLECPSDMVAIDARFCVDVFEASRADATAANVGTDSSVATSRAGVLPWQVASNATAHAACQAANKTLCSAAQWQAACAGPEQTAYVYGDEYDPTACNGIDAYCRCDSGPCGDASPCPYPHCYGTCGVSRRLGPDPTGSHASCTNGFGIYDMNGNLWEHVLGGDDRSVRGGAYNCLDSERLHRCVYVPGTWRPSARGFRCCSSGSPK